MYLDSRNCRIFLKNQKNNFHFSDDLGCILGTKSEKLQKKNKDVSSDDEEKGQIF